MIGLLQRPQWRFEVSMARLPFTDDLVRILAQLLQLSLIVCTKENSNGLLIERTTSI